jgi:FkbM family methyltransferase
MADSTTVNGIAPSTWIDLVGSLARACPRMVRGKSRVARKLLGSSLQSRDVVLRSRAGNEFVIPHLSEPVGFELLVNGDYEPATESWIREHLQPGGTFVDVGANIGLFSVAAAQCVGANGRVLAIEASPAVFPYLKENVARNRVLNVLLEHCAASEHDAGSVSFWEAPVSQFGMGSLAQQFGSNPLNVPAHMLDTLLQRHNFDRVDVLKVDVEGFEAAVFRGAHQLLSGKQRPSIVFEFLDWAEARMLKAEPGDAQRVLLQHGYRLRRLGGRLEGIAVREPVTHGSAMLVAEPS